MISTLERNGMLKRTSNKLLTSFLSLCLLAAFTVAPALGNAQADKKQEAKEKRNKPEKSANKRNDKKSNKKGKESDNTIWLEEKLNPSTQWLEKTVKPLTRWIEDQVQLEPKEQRNKQAVKKPRPQENHQRRPANNFAPNSSGKPLSEADIRRLLKQRYSANVLHIKALGQGQQRRYRVKLINQQGVIQILYLSAMNGQEISR
ncbi:hypothetical protein [Pseudoteredinibacter isoporae]|uniref:PepSY domain-containing protein n=1 Tax=Pseudoteredinibacter isoporae TaxID=570281 RepID=A0A7X0MW37_9GAMM|nr:hypothetical protein [Pseudoteredinibacter isoporae]MBB6522033.1 hypothetical protein [Pseudoteredinibacter isoporae]NHO87569.1 hypothetical protein [Pseudoteredinibacter isoporae]NIB24100.1 hypothetical protein [Pseudoteredinibacter isoporae]